MTKLSATAHWWSCALKSENVSKDCFSDQAIARLLEEKKYCKYSRRMELKLERNDWVHSGCYLQMNDMVMTFFLLCGIAPHRRVFYQTFSPGGILLNLVLPRGILSNNQIKKYIEKFFTMMENHHACQQIEKKWKCVRQHLQNLALFPSCTHFIIRSRGVRAASAKSP